MKRQSKNAPITAATFNALVAEVQRLGRVRVAPPLGYASTSGGQMFWIDSRAESWIGEIVCCGSCAEDEGDTPCNSDGGCEGACSSFTNNRYWVVRCELSNNADDFCSAATFEVLDVNNRLYRKVAATNLTEDAIHSHVLNPGTKVRVYGDFDHGTPPRIRYYFSQGLGPFSDDVDCGTRNCEGSSSGSSSGSESQSQSGSTHCLSIPTNFEIACNLDGTITATGQDYVSVPTCPT